MDRNLGASRVATSSTDSAAYGDLYQWERGADGHQLRTSGTTLTPSSTDVPRHGNFIMNVNTSPYDWRVPQEDSLWQGGSGTNNPCPAGFRLPTETELETERAAWGSNDTAGAFASPLKLVAAGYRYTYLNGTTGTGAVGIIGLYWGSTVNGDYARFLSIYYPAATEMSNGPRAHGYSVRCQGLRSLCFYDISGTFSLHPGGCSGQVPL